jgi:hypothetical protein
MQPPSITISVDSWVGAVFALGFLIPLSIAAIAGGYILGGFVLERLGKTVLGIHVRHLLTRIAPTKFFKDGDLDDRLFVIDTIKKAIESGKLKIHRD